MTATTGSAAEVVLAALRKVPGLRPATPRWGSRLDLLAVDVGADVVEVRLVALALPLPPLLRQAETVLRQALVDVGRADSALRLVITDLDAAAFSKESVTNPGAPGQTG